MNTNSLTYSMISKAVVFARHHWEFIIAGVTIPILLWMLSEFKKSKGEKSAPSPTPAPPDSDPLALPRVIRFRPASAPDFRSIASLADHFLGAGHGIAEETVQKWHERNKEIFRVVECRTKESVFRRSWNFCGYYSVVPITRATYEHLTKGQIQDFQIEPSAISKFSDPDVPAIYIMDVMTADGLCPERGCASTVAQAILRDLMWNLQRILQAAPHIDEVSSIVATPIGKKLVKKAGFRKDAHFTSPYGWERWTIQTKKPGLEKAAQYLGTLREANRFRATYTL